MTLRATRRIALLAGAAWLVPLSRAQLNVGVVEGSAFPAARLRLRIEGPLGMAIALDTDARGRFRAVLPYGIYTVRAESLRDGCRVRIRPLETTSCDLRAGVNRTAESDENSEPTAYNTAQYLLFQVPAITSYPLDFSNLGSIRLPLISAWSLPWTATTLCLNALDATDSYQPGIPVLLDDAKAEDAPPRMDRYSAGIFLRSAENSWHVGFATENTGSVFAGDNLPPLPGRGSVERPQEFRWFTRDTVELSGPLTRWADISATATGQWASQTAPLWPEAIPIDSRTLIGNARGSVRLSPRDRIDALYSGSRLDLSRGGWPSGIEAILASPIMPSFYGVDGFENLREVDLFDLVQAGWTREFGGSALELLADLLNLLNNGNKIVESDLSGLLFNQRPALAVPPPRTLRLGLRWHY